MTRTQAERRLRELMAEIRAVTDPDVTIAAAGEALLAHRAARGCSKSHLETAESHLRVHIVPFFKAKPVDRISDLEVTRLLVHLRRSGRAPKGYADYQPGEREAEIVDRAFDLDRGSWSTTPTPADSGLEEAATEPAVRSTG